MLLRVDAQHPLRAPTLHLDRVKARVAADVEDALAGEILRQSGRKVMPLHGWVIAQEVVRRSFNPAHTNVVEAGTGVAEAGLQIIVRRCLRCVCCQNG